MKPIELLPIDLMNGINKYLPTLYQTVLVDAVAEMVEVGQSMFRRRTGYMANYFRPVIGQVSSVEVEMKIGWWKSNFLEGRFYPVFYFEGTGIYGSERRPIRPVRAPFLVWTDWFTGEVHRAKEVKGQEPKKQQLEVLLELFKKRLAMYAPGIFYKAVRSG